jgi:cation diffusion facilitator CzcD-associated flavoprotein CzcO
VADPDYEVAIIGAGPGGIAAAKLLRDKGITDFIILERGPDFGGTWRDNHYPGLAVDIPVLWYQCLLTPTPIGRASLPPAPRSTGICATPPRASSSTSTSTPMSKSSNKSGMRQPINGTFPSGTSPRCRHAS